MSNKNIRIPTNNNQGVEKAPYKTKGIRLDMIFFFFGEWGLRMLDTMSKDTKKYIRRIVSIRV
jgi:hypothetical protein